MSTDNKDYQKSSTVSKKEEKQTLPFKKRLTFEQRKAEAVRIRAKYPDRIPILVERHNKSTTVNQIEKEKYLAPIDLTVGQFNYVIGKRVKTNSEMAIFLFVNENHLLPTATLLSQVYKEYKDADQFLYIAYASEATFG